MHTHTCAPVHAPPHAQAHAYTNTVMLTHTHLCTQLHSRLFEKKYVTFVLMIMRFYNSTNIPFLDKALMCIKITHFTFLYLLMDIRLNWDFAIRVLIY